MNSGFEKTLSSKPELAHEYRCVNPLMYSWSLKSSFLKRFSAISAKIFAFTTIESGPYLTWELRSGSPSCGRTAAVQEEAWRNRECQQHRQTMRVQSTTTSNGVKMTRWCGSFYPESEIQIRPISVDPSSTILIPVSSQALPTQLLKDYHSLLDSEPKPPNRHLHHDGNFHLIILACVARLEA